MLEQQDGTVKQPFLPRFGMVWFFIVVTIVAIALGIIRAADQGQALAAAIVFIGVFFSAVAIFSSVSFLVAFSFGAMERAVVGGRQQTQNPFVDGSLPEQILPPKNIDGQ